jgi:hypothetical protein
LKKCCPEGETVDFDRKTCRQLKVDEKVVGEKSLKVFDSKSGSEVSRFDIKVEEDEKFFSCQKVAMF